MESNRYTLKIYLNTEPEPINLLSVNWMLDESATREKFDEVFKNIEEKCWNFYQKYNDKK